MGCWNETDALTQLPILPGDPVKLMVVTSRSEESTVVRCLPISGIYDDYGCIKDIVEDWATTAFLACCNSLMKEGRWKFAPGEEKRIEMDNITIPFDTVKDLLRAIERGYIVSAEYGSNIPVFFVMVHDDLYAKAVDMGGAYIDYSNETFLAKIKKRTAPVQDQIKALFGEHAEQENAAQTLAFLASNILLNGFFQAMLGSLQGSCMRRVYGDSCFGGSLKCVPNTLPDDYTERLLQLACFNFFLMLTRKILYKQAGSGSQGAEFATMASFFEHAKFFAMKKYAEQDYDEDEEYDEDE